MPHGIRLTAVAFPLFLAWELLQARGFTGLPGDWWRTAAICTLASVGDVVLVLAVFAAGTGVFRDTGWFAPPTLGRYAGLVVFGVGLQAVIERLAVDWLGLWAYAPGHPLVPVVDVGLLPILQAVVLLPVTFGLAAWWERRR